MSMLCDGTSPLPAAWYLGADAFATERREVFARGWQMIARADALKAPGDYVCANLAGLAVFAMRSEAGTVGAFSNVCRHQSLPVLDAGAGRCPLLRCRYHGWTYNFDGSFKEAPEKYGPADKASPDNHLRALPLSAWRGLLFVAPDATVPGLAETLAPLGAALGLERNDALACAGEVTTDFQCNWKFLIEHWLAEKRVGEAGGDGSTWLWSFPAFLVEHGAGVRVIHQVIARTLDRTRVISHILVASGIDGASLIAHTRDALAADKSDCEARQVKAAETGAVDTPTAVAGGAHAAFRRHIIAILGAEGANS
jgi:nitrite reductase/ring-hydroxylating ferredoxin subunit